MKKITNNISFFILSILILGLYISTPALAQTTNLKDNSGLKQGLWVIKKDSQIVEKGTYKNNKKVGVWCSYYNNGKIKTEITFTNGEPKGHTKLFYENGTLREEGNWQVDHWEGSYKYYFESGILSYDWFYNGNGKRQGEQRYFYDNGVKMYEGKWENGKTEGILKVYNDQGELIQEKIFNKGKFTEAKKPIKNEDIPTKFSGTGFHTIMNLRGEIDEKGFFVKGDLINGEKYNYDEQNNLISITIYKDGKSTGSKQAK